MHLNQHWNHHQNLFCFLHWFCEPGVCLYAFNRTSDTVPIKERLFWFIAWRIWQDWFDWTQVAFSWVKVFLPGHELPGQCHYLLNLWRCLRWLSLPTFYRHSFHRISCICPPRVHLSSFITWKISLGWFDWKLTVFHSIPKFWQYPSHHHQSSHHQNLFIHHR